TPQSVYQMDTAGMRRLTADPQLLQPGQSLTLPDGQGTLTFTGYRPWVSLAITHDPGQVPALVCGIAALGGLLLSFMVRRRRVFVRARAGGPGSTVQVGGLARTDASGGFEAEFASLAAELRSAHNRAAHAQPGHIQAAHSQAAHSQAAHAQAAIDPAADPVTREEAAGPVTQDQADDPVTRDQPNDPVTRDQADEPVTQDQAPRDQATHDDQAAHDQQEGE
ncbi:MAG TPA: cytochrome c biogenesis protein ResB, partial [Streptosporangiaceae bacterium]|nr:cytochrome c biogenesis protein ResB [Streptosporangiaceae bacterium]